VTSRRLSLACLLVLVLNGCGGGKSTPIPASASAACEALHDARAKYDARCLGGGEGQWRGYEDGREDCSTYDRHVKEGTVVFRSSGWADCLKMYEQPCDQPIDESCVYESLHGVIADGKPCEDSQVCGTQSACFPVGNDICSRICVRGGNLNDRCGLYCGDATPCDDDLEICSRGLVCDNGTCLAGGAVGDWCGGPAAHVCARGLFCDPNTSNGSGRCVARAVGGLCFEDADCMPLQFCDDDTDTCLPRREVGASCRGAFRGCVAWTVCDELTETCQPAGQVGQPCGQFPGTAGYAICSAGACRDGRRCSAFAGAGQGCAAAACAGELVCDSATVTCRSCGGGGTAGAGGSVGMGGAGGGAVGTGGGPGGSAGAAGAAGTGGIPAASGLLLTDFSGGSSLVGPPYVGAGQGWVVPTVSASGGALHATLNSGVSTAMYPYAYFGLPLTNPPFIASSNAVGVRFTISGTLADAGCQIQYSTVDQDHATTTMNGHCVPADECYPSGQLFALPTTPTKVTVRWSDQVGGSGYLAASSSVNPAQIVGLQWLVASSGAIGSSCVADIVIDDISIVDW
jgi:hypothetical protein